MTRDNSSFQEILPRRVSRSVLVARKEVKSKGGLGFVMGEIRSCSDADDKNKPIKRGGDDAAEAAVSGST